VSEYALEVKELAIDAVDRQGRRTPIVREIDFEVPSGKVLALIGESGSGKTTISLAVMGYVKAGLAIRDGVIRLDGHDVLGLDGEGRRSMRGTEVAYIAQSAAAAFNGALRIGPQVVEIPVTRNLMAREEAEKRAIALYEQLGLPNPDRIGELYPHQVSGGQLQRLMAAMAMVCEPKVLILDEPTTALDVTTQVEVLESFRSLIRRRNTAAIYVSHDLSVVAQIADEVLVLREGRIVERGETEKIINRPRSSYTKTLIGAVSVLPASRHVDEQTEREAPLLHVENVTAGYGRRVKDVVLHGVSLSVAPGETLGVIGESGSGKSTLGRVISGLMEPLSGAVRLRGQTLAPVIEKRSQEDARRIQFVFQMADTALNPRQRVAEMLGRPLARLRSMKGERAATRVRELLDMVGLSGMLAERFPHELSGGQKQRVNLARALAAEPELIICDEITSSLDTVVQANIIALLRDLREELRLTLIFISHDLSTVASFAQRLAVMREGRVVDYGSTNEVLSPPHHPYTELLLTSVPQLRIGWLDEVMARRRSGGDSCRGNGAKESV